MLYAPLSLGELVDKITILEIKTQHLQGQGLINARHELKVLQQVLVEAAIQLDPDLIDQLQQVNQSLWSIEDAIREQERLQDFGQAFIQLARSVYRQNDRRAAIKRKINTTYGSDLVEEKSYKPY